MKASKRQAAIRLYLLGGLDKEGQQQIEERVMTDRGFQEEVCMIEDELLEDYLAGTLTQAERNMFQQHYLAAPRQQQKLLIAQALNKYVGLVPSPPPIKSHVLRTLINLFKSQGRLAQISWVGALTIILLCGSWLLFGVWHIRTEEARLRAELTRLNDPGISELPPSPSVVAVTFPPFQFRGETKLKDVIITSETKIVQLRIPLASERYQTYRVAIKVAGSADEILKLGNLRARSSGQTTVLVLQVPAWRLQPNEYLFSVRGSNNNGDSEEIGDYSFRVLPAPP
jgi:hypothetical protein